MRALAFGAASIQPRRLLSEAGIAVGGFVLAGLVAALPLEASVGVAAALVAIVAGLVEPFIALLLLLASIPFSTLVTIEAGDFSVTAVEPLFALLLLSWLGQALRRRAMRLAGGAVLAGFALIVLVTLVSSLVAARLGLTFKEVAKWLELVTVLAYVASEVRSRERQRLLLAVLFAVGSLEALYGVYQYRTGSGPAAFTIGDVLRAYGHFEQPNPFAGYLGTMLPLAVAMLFGGRDRRLTVLAGGAAALLGLGILLSLSRGAWVGLALGLGLMLLVWSPGTRRVFTALVACLVLLILLTATNILPGAWADRLVAVLDNFGVFDVRTVDITPENFAVVERMAHWQAGWGMFLEQPWLGVGAGNYPARYEEYMMPGWVEPLGHAHNYYLNMAAETGIVGLLALVGALATVFRTIAGGLKRAALGSETRALLTGLLGSFTVLIVHNLFDNLLVHGMAVQIGALAGLVVAVASPSSESVPPEAVGGHTA